MLSKDIIRFFGWATNVFLIHLLEFYHYLNGGGGANGEMANLTNEKG